MQDYNYLHSNSYELTIEMGCFKYPPASQLEQFWKDHRVPLVVLMEKVSRCLSHGLPHSCYGRMVGDNVYHF